MKKVDDLQIGEKFRLGDREFVIEEEKIEGKERGYCVGCFFYGNELGCSDFRAYNFIPECSHHNRKDKKDVIFKEVENERN